LAAGRKVLVGRILGAHGIRGEVKLVSFTADPDAISAYGPLETERGGTVEIERLRARKDGFIAVLKGVGDRNVAEALRGTELFVARGRLPEPGKGEVYLDDLLGLPVHMEGQRLGEIVGIANFGAGDLLDVKVDGRRDTVYIPLAGRYIAEVSEKQVSVTLPEGFLDEGEAS